MRRRLPIFSDSIPRRKSIFFMKISTPIYCFAEDQCLSSANIILTCGVKVYASIYDLMADSMSLMGDFGYSWSSLWFKDFA